MKILFAASGEFAVPSIDALLRGGHRILRVYTQPDRPAGRGKRALSTPAGAYGDSLGLEVVRTENFNAEPLPPADLLVVIAFGQKIAHDAVNHCRLGSVNLHASLLPRGRGAAPINWAILEGDRETGNSIIRLAERMDAGAILAQSVMGIGETETAGELHDRLAIDGAELLHRTVEALDKGEIQEREQEPSLVRLARKLSRGQAKINFNGDATGVSRMIRGLFPWPGCRAMLLDEQSKIVGSFTLARAVEAESCGGMPGRIDGQGRVACGVGSVKVLELIPDGKRLMTLDAYRNGHPWNPGYRLEPLA